MHANTHKDEKGNTWMKREREIHTICIHKYTRIDEWISLERRERDRHTHTCTFMHTNTFMHTYAYIHTHE